MIPAAPDAGVRFNPPPGWAVPAGFDPRRGHLADPAWPSAPEAWPFWVADASLGRESVTQGTLPSATLPRGRFEPRERRRLMIVLACVLAFIGVMVWTGVASGDHDVSTGLGSCWSGGARVHAVSCDSSDAAYVVREIVDSPDQCPASSPGYIEYGGDVLCLHGRG